MEKIIYKQLERVANPSQSEFNKNYGYKSVPVVITDVMKQWKAITSWTEEFFKNELHNVEDYAVRTDNDNDKRLFKLSEYFDYMRNCPDERPYYFKNSRFHLKTRMVNDYVVPDYFKSCLSLINDTLPLSFQLSWMYIGARDTYSKLHLDIYNTSAWNAVVSGKKRWLFYPPAQGKYLYDGAVNPFRPDFEKYPEFAKAEPLVCIQYPGEIVFTPTGWWHAVYNEEAGVSITENFINDTNYDIVRMTLLYHNRMEEIKTIDHCMSEFSRNELLV